MNQAPAPDHAALLAAKYPALRTPCPNLSGANGPMAAAIHGTVNCQGCQNRGYTAVSGAALLAGLLEIALPYRPRFWRMTDAEADACDPPMPHGTVVAYLEEVRKYRQEPFQKPDEYGEGPTPEAALAAALWAATDGK